MTPREVQQVRRFFPRLVFLLSAVFWALPVHVQAVGPIVDQGCMASWCAPATRTDGRPITGILTYNLYLEKGTPAAPMNLPRWTGITGVVVSPPCEGGLVHLAMAICGGLPKGQYTVWATAVEDQAGVAVESALSNPAPFCVSRSHKAHWCR